VSSVVLVLVAPVVIGVLLAVFVHWERTGREHWPVFLILGLLVFESSLYENQTDIPRGIFHPGGGSLQFRLPEVLITLALIARLVVRGRSTKVGVPALLWLAWAAWMVVEAVEGVLRHNSTVKLPYEAKAIVYVVGAYALCSGIPVRRFFEGKGFERLLRWSGLSATVLIFMTLAHKSYAVPLPLLKLTDFGVLGTDAASIFVALGVIGFLFELAKTHRSRLNLLVCVPLLFSAFFAFQRAALLALGASVTVVVIAALGPTARRRLRVGAGEVAVTALAVVGVALGVAVIPAITAQKPVTVPFASTIGKAVSQTVGSESKVESAQSRLNKWQVSLADARQQPILGQGLGFEYSYFAPGPNQFVVTDLTENIELDLWLRTGIIGLAIFLLALGTSIVNGLAIWRVHPDPMVGVFALALVAVVVGMVAKGQAESIFENYRLATVLGLELGMLRSAVTSAGGRTAIRTYQTFPSYEVV